MSKPNQKYTTVKEHEYTKELQANINIFNRISHGLKKDFYAKRYSKIEEGE